MFELNMNIIIVWIIIYNEFKFSIFGVNIWLFVIVWNIIVVNVIYFLFNIIVNIFGIFCDNVYFKWFMFIL